MYGLGVNSTVLNSTHKNGSEGTLYVVCVLPQFKKWATLEKHDTLSQNKTKLN